MADIEITKVNDHLGPGGQRGLSLLTASVFVIGELAGAGILSLPQAISHTSWYGLFMLGYCGTLAGVAGVALSNCWLVLEERYPEYRNTLTRKPYATIASHAFGPWMSAVVSILMNITRIGAGTVFMLLSSNLLHSITKSFIHLSNCQWIPITGAILLVPMWLGSPADFWPMAYSAMISSVLGSFLVIARTLIELTKHGFEGKEYYMDEFTNFAGAFGTILFAFGGASAFPNFQNDMKKKSQFTKAVMIGFSALMLIYVPTAGLGYAAFGKNVKSDIIDNFDADWMVYTVQSCFLVHCLTVILIVVNPVYLDLEELFRVPKRFSVGRVTFRTSLHLLMLFLGLTFPSFGQILDLIGGSSLTLIAFIFPPIFYYKLCRDSRLDEKWQKRVVPVWLLVVYGLIVVTGLSGGISSTYSTIKNWTPLSSACYLSKSEWQGTPVNQTSPA